MRLEPVTPANYAAAVKLSVRDDQQGLVAPVVNSLAEAYVYGDHAWPRLICDGDTPVGFVMAFVDLGWKDMDDPDRRTGFWRLLIAAEHQAGVTAGSRSRRSVRSCGRAGTRGST